MEPEPTTVATSIAALRPSLDQLCKRQFTAVVTLVWPYSSASKGLSLLLSDPDFRLRYTKNGQVRVHFRSPAAEEVVKLKISIGDQLLLSVVGSQWKQHVEKVGIFENCIDWELSYSDRLQLQVRRHSTIVSSVDLKADPQSEKEERSAETPKHILSPQRLSLPSDWASPAFTKRLADFTPRKHPVAPSLTQDEDGHIPGIGRKRPRFGRPTGEWTFVEAPASPVASVENFGEELEAAVSRSVTPLVVRDLQEPTPPQPESAELPITQSDAAVAEAHPDTEDGRDDTLMSRDILALPSTAEPRSSSISKEPLPEQGPVSETGLLLAPDNNRALIPSGTAALEPFNRYSALTEPELSKRNEVHPPSSTVDRHLVFAADSQSGLLASEALSNFDLLNDAARQDPNMFSPSVEWSASIQAPEEIPEFRATSQVNLPASEYSSFGEVGLRTGIQPNLQGSSPIPVAVAQQVLSEAETYRVPGQTAQQWVGVGNGGSRSPESKGDDFGEGSGHGSAYAYGDEQRWTEAPWMRGPGESEISEVAEESDIRDYYDEEDQGKEEEPEEDEEEPLSDSDEEEEEGEEGEEDETYGDYEEDFREYRGIGIAQVDAPFLNQPSEVIVLDSDSEDEKPASAVAAMGQTAPFAQSSSKSEFQRHQYAEAEAGSSQGDPSEEEASGPETSAKDTEADADEAMNEAPSVMDYSAPCGDVEEPVDICVPEVGNTRADQDGLVIQVTSPQEHHVLQWDAEGTSREHEPDDVAEAAAQAVSPEDERRKTDSVRESFPESSSEHSVEDISDLPTGPTGVQKTVSVTTEIMELPNGESSPMQVISEAVVETVTAEGHTTLTTTEESDAESINNYGNRSTVEGQLLGGNISNEVLEPSLGGKRTQKDLVRLEEQNRPGTATIPIREAIASADISAHNYRGGDQPYREVVNQPPKSPSPSIQLHQELLAFSRLADYELGLNRSEAVEVQATQGVGHERELSDDGTQEATDFDSSLIAESHDLEYIQASAEEDVTSDAVVETDLPGPDMNAEGFRSRMSYYSPLATLCQTFGAQIDAMVVVLDTKEIENTSTTTCPYQLSLEVTEPSMSGTAVPVEIVRAPDREALPSVRRGDVVLLRDFTVRTMDHKLMLMSSDISAWAVFDQPDGNIEDVQVNGRPVEFGLEEFDHAKRLREWFTEKGLALAIRQAARRRALEQLSDPAEEASYSSSISSSDTIRRHNASGAATPRNWAKIPKKKNRSLTEKNRRITIHKMRYGRQYTEVGSPPAKEILHELRDGTTWSDI